MRKLTLSQQCAFRECLARLFERRKVLHASLSIFAFRLSKKIHIHSCHIDPGVYLRSMTINSTVYPSAVRYARVYVVLGREVLRATSNIFCIGVLEKREI